MVFGLTRSQLISIGVALQYVFISFIMTFFNKAVLSQYSFKFPSVILIGQLVFTIVVLRLLKLGKFVAFEAFNWPTAKQVLVVAVLYSTNVGIALVALSSLNIPMYSTFKRLTIAVVMVLEYFLLKKVPSKAIVGTVAMMSVGAMLAGLGDVSFDPTGYVMAILSCVLQALYLVVVAKKEKELDLNTFGLLYYNSILSLPFVFAVGLVKSEYSSALHYDRWHEFGFLFNFLMACALGALLNYSIFLCTLVNSPLTLTVSGQAKSILTVAIGFFAFGGVAFTPLNAFGIILNTLGSLVYSFTKHIEKSRAESLPSGTSNSQRTQDSSNGAFGSK